VTALQAGWLRCRPAGCAAGRLAALQADWPRCRPAGRAAGRLAAAIPVTGAAAARNGGALNAAGSGVRGLLAGELRLVKLGVQTAGGQQFLVPAPLADLPAVDDQNLVGFPDRR
jgi:hypothetical protein